MGECAYYLKAEFPTKKDAIKVEQKLDAFFAEAREAYEYYQSVLIDLKTFWSMFSRKYPRVMDYVKTLPEYKNGCEITILSGKLDFGQDENNEIYRMGNILSWGDAAVWHMADWNYLADYIRDKYKAIKVVWGTEEDGCGSLNTLQLYDWEKIVHDILEHKELHPLLIGANKELDRILDIKMRKHHQKATTHAATKE